MKKSTAFYVLAAAVSLAAATASLAAAGRAPHARGPAPLAQGRALYQQRMLAGPNGHYDAVRIQSSLQARRRLLTVRSSTAAESQPGINWTEIGPGNIGGRINTIWVDPTNGQHLIVGAAGGGLWQSLDGGSSWTAIADFPGTLAVGAFAQLSSTTFLAGTGDQFNEPQPGIGLVISTDGGTTWNPITATAPSASNPDWYYVNSIAVSSNGTLLAATGNGGTPPDLLNTTEPGQFDGGVWRSTDSGQSWTKVWPVAGEDPSYDVVFDPNNASSAVAGTDTGTVVYSTDGGATWSVATGLPTQTSLGYRVSLAFDSSTTGSVYALVDNAPSGGPSGEVFHSTDGGATWSLLAGTGAFVNQDSGTATGALCDNSEGGSLECQGYYDNVIAVFPQGAGKPPYLLTGGVDIFASPNGGSTWTEAGSWLPGDPNYVHADQHAITLSPTEFYVGNDGGVYELPLSSTSFTWIPVNSGLAVTQFYRIDGYSGVTASQNAPGGVPITPILAGAQDNGMLLYEGYTSSGAPQPNNWVPFFGGDGVAALVDPVDGNFLYGEYPHLSISYSTTGGPSGQYFISEPPDDTANPQTANFIAPIALVPNSAQAATQMLAGGATLWLGSNIQSGSPSWTPMSGNTLPVTSNGNYISAIEIDPNTNNNIWVGFDDGEVWYTTNAMGSSGPTWSQAGSGALPTNQQVTGIWVVPGQSATVYVTFAGFPAGGDNIFETTDGGATWQGIGAGLPPGPVYSLVTDPNYPQVLYVGTYTGVYTSSDNGQTWSTSNVGPANIAVDQLTWFASGSPPTLLAATDGRGAWLGSPAYNPTPTLTALNPAQVLVGAGATTVTLTGTGFIGASTVNFDGTPLTTTFVSSTQLQASAPSSTLATAGTYTFTVGNPVPGGGTSAGATFTVANPLPSLLSVSPNSMQAGSGGFTLTVNGSGFVAASTIQWNGFPLGTTFNSSGSLTAAVPASDVAAAGVGTVTVTSPAPGGGASTAVSFSITAPPSSKGGGGGMDIWTLFMLMLMGLVFRRGRSAIRRRTKQ
jgi:hypothetical protein